MSETVTLKINGHEVTVPKGATVMQAADKAKIDIPHFCWHPGLKIAGVCRFCMVKVEGRPKLEIACNLQATPGMDVRTDTEEVKGAHKWALEFHLINHPLDCPICDQAGECGLQDSYMAVGKYESQMTRPKVLKPKALDVGRDLVLDTERCILCSRCVRFEEDVTKTGALGIFDRGDRSIIGTYPDKPIQHNYQTNLVDICPVGAFTSRDFRFKQRVWFLKDQPAICPGCSTGCHVDVYAKPENRAYYRIKPRESEVNGFWMCDFGRHMYTHLNQENRLRTAYAPAGGKQKPTTLSLALSSLGAKIKATPADKIALLVSAQYTTEEYEAFFEFFVKNRGIKKVYQWREPSEKITEFDGLLLRGDHNANTRGLVETLKKYGLNTEVKNQFDDVAKAGAELVIALAPEIPATFPNIRSQLRSLAELGTTSYWGMALDGVAMGGFLNLIPLQGFAEKKGSFLNFEGKVGKLDAPFPCPYDDVKDVRDVVRILDEHVTKVPTNA